MISTISDIFLSTVFTVLKNMSTKVSEMVLHDHLLSSIEARCHLSNSSK